MQILVFCDMKIYYKTNFKKMANKHNFWKSLRVCSFSDEKMENRLYRFFSYTSTDASKIFNYKKSYCRTSRSRTSKLNHLTVLAKTLFKYGPSGNAITGDLSIIENEYLRNILPKGPKYH